MRKGKFLIVGGGVIGLSIAEQLTRRGQACLLLDQGPFAQEASWAGAGYLDLRDAARTGGAFFDLCRRSYELYPTWTERLFKDTGLDPEWMDSGSLDLAFDEEEEAGIRTTEAGLRSRGLHGRWLSPSEAREMEPGLSPRLRSAFRFKGTAQVRPPRLNRALLTYLQKAGAELRELEQVEDFVLDGRKIVGVKTSKGFHEGDQVVLASGAWSAPLAQKLGLSLPVKPIRGQVVMVRARPGTLGHILFKGQGKTYTYLVPRRDGHIYVGSTLEDAGFDKGTTPEGLGKLKTGLTTMLPGLSQQWIEDTWSGLRPSSPDGLPFLGRIPGMEGAWIATGHFTHGLLLSAATGDLMARALTGEGNLQELEPFSAARIVRPATRS
jgi:glycine oxidase